MSRLSSWLDRIERLPLTPINGAPGRTRTCNPQLRRLMLYPVELQALRLSIPFLSKKWSGWRDSNSRPTAPKAVALPGCATPRNRLTCRCYGLHQIASIHLHRLGNQKPNKFKRPPNFGWPHNIRRTRRIYSGHPVLRPSGRLRFTPTFA